MSDIILSDKDIDVLMKEKKRFPDNYQNLFQVKSKRGHDEQELTIPRKDGSQFKVILRQNQVNPLAFSLILGYVPAKSTGLFRLRRYNGKSHEHTNKIERNTFYDFHIHQATERYQAAGFKEEAYAVVCAEYANVREALDCFIKDCAIILPDEHQLRIKTK